MPLIIRSKMAHFCQYPGMIALLVNNLQKHSKYSKFILFILFVGMSGEITLQLLSTFNKVSLQERSRYTLVFNFKINGENNT